MGRFLKRSMDCVLVLLALPLLLVVILIVAAVIFVVDGRPIFFTQIRVGKEDRLFRLIKFRTMSVPELTPSGYGVLDDDAVRVTALGKLLRSTSLDELPSLFNVLRGDMSLVGPRPLLPQYLKLYSDEQRRRHEVRPGITGLAQVSGRNSLAWSERLELDVTYVDSWSIWLDIRILLLTARAVVTRRGISSDGHATSPPFTGGGS